MASILFLKAMVAGHIKADGTMVRTYHRKDRRSLEARYGRVVAAAKRAYDALPLEAKLALDSWKRANWHLSPLHGAYRDNPAQADIRQAMEHAMVPVRRVLHAEFGPTITLHRGERHYDADFEEPRALYSWTLDPQVAADFARRARPVRPMPEAEVDRIVAQFEATGYARSGHRAWMRDPDHPGTFLIFKDREVVTDGDDLRSDLERERAETMARNAEIIARGRIYTEAIPVEDIAWVLDDARQREFLVRRPPRRAS